MALYWSATLNVRERVGESVAIVQQWRIRTRVAELWVSARQGRPNPARQLELL